MGSAGLRIASMQSPLRLREVLVVSLTIFWNPETTRRFLESKTTLKNARRPRETVRNLSRLKELKLENFLEDSMETGRRPPELAWTQCFDEYFEDCLQTHRRLTGLQVSKSIGYHPETCSDSKSQIVSMCSPGSFQMVSRRSPSSLRAASMRV